MLRLALERARARAHTHTQQTYIRTTLFSLTLYNPRRNVYPFRLR